DTRPLGSHQRDRPDAVADQHIDRYHVKVGSPVVEEGAEYLIPAALGAPVAAHPQPITGGSHLRRRIAERSGGALAVGDGPCRWRMRAPHCEGGISRRTITLIPPPHYETTSLTASKTVGEPRHRPALATPSLVRPRGWRDGHNDPASTPAPRDRRRCSR